MSAPRRKVPFIPTAGFKADLQELHDAAVQNPGGPQARLFQVALNQLDGIIHGKHSTHALTFMPSYPDLSDCQTTYVGAEPNAKPSHRIVWRDVASDQPGQPPTREIIALAKRDHGQAYYIAGQRLGRPVGYTLEQLNRLVEPITTRQSSPQVTDHHTVDRAMSTASEDDFELG